MSGRARLKFLRLGSRHPTSAVALFHGLGGSRNELKPMARRWQAALPSAAFLLFESPDRDYHERVLLNGDWSGDWYRFPHLRSAFDGSDEGERAYLRMVTQTISERCDQVSEELDVHLAEMGVANDRLVLAGFSQGAAVSTYTGLRRRCLGVMPFGGPCPPHACLLPSNDVTHICAVVGDQDHCASHREIAQSFEKYEGRTAASCCTHVIAGMRHVISETSISIGETFLRRLLL